MLRFVTSESTNNVMCFWLDYLLSHGRPCSIYTNRCTVYCVTNNNDEKEKKSQFERACLELDIKTIRAYSPQTKGRVERLFETLQDRLVKKIRELGISSIEQANEYLKQSVLAHNQKFARKPALPQDLHRAFTRYNLNDIFCLKEMSTVSHNRTIQYQKHIFQVLSHTSAQPNDRITFLEHLDSTITLKNSRAINLSLLKSTQNQKEKRKYTLYKIGQ